MKKTFFLIAALCCTLLAKADYAKIGNIYYNLDNSDHTASVTSGTDEYSGIINIPHSVTYNSVQYLVTSIGEYAFMNCSNLTSVSIPSSVTTIGYCAFLHCANAASISLPNSIASIGDHAFNDCGSLTSINIPSSVTHIGTSTFESCLSLTSITIPSSVTSIGDCAFSSCTNLSSISLPNSLTSIGQQSFMGCTSLTEVTIPSSVTSIGEWAFRYCFSLTSVTCERENPVALSAEVFYSCNMLSDIYVLFTSMSLYKSADGWSAYADKIKATPLTNAAYQAGLSAAFGNMGTEHSGPAIEVTKGTKSIILYQPDKVEFIMVNDEK